MTGPWGWVDENKSLCQTLREPFKQVIAGLQPGELWLGWQGWPSLTLQVSDPGVIHPPHEDRKLVLLVPKQEEEGLLHLKGQQIAGHRDGRG